MSSKPLAADASAARIHNKETLFHHNAAVLLLYCCNFGRWVDFFKKFHRDLGCNYALLKLLSSLYSFNYGPYFIAGLELAQASSNKQITLSPPSPATVTSSPPPPLPPGSPPPATFLSPGFDFSLIIPGFTTATFGTAQQNALCSAITNNWSTATSATTCIVGNVSTFNGTSALLTGYAYFTYNTIPTITELQTAAALRDARVVALTTNTTSVLGSVFPTALPNCACNGLSVVSKPSTAPFNYVTNITGAIGPMQCDARLTYDTSNPNNLINQVGIDDGSTTISNVSKYCSTPAVKGGVVGVPGTGSCRQYGIQGAGTGVTATAITNVLSGSAVQVNGQCSGPNRKLLTIGGCFTPGSGYTSNPTVTVSAPTPTGVQVKFPWSGGGAVAGTLAGVVQNTNGPYATATAYPVGILGGGTCVDAGKGATYTYQDHLCTGPIVTIQDPNGIPRSGYTCTSADFNSGRACGPFPGTNCMVISGINNGVSAIKFPGLEKGGSTSANRGVFCAATPTITFDNSQALQAPSYAQFNAVIDTSGPNTGKVTSVTMVSPGSGYLTAPTLTISPPTAGTPKLCGPNPIPSLSTSIANPIASSISADGPCFPLGRDTASNMVCSIPAAPGGTYEPLNVGTCNVVSSFIPQPGSAVSSTCGIVPQAFNVSVAAAPVPAPAPVPTPAPKPAPAPVPGLAPGSGPTPGPTPDSTTCSYIGNYTIEAVACPGKFIAYNNDPAKNDACNNGTVMLRTETQSQGPRRFWLLNANATDKQPPAASSQIASGRTGKCNNDKYTNLAAANSPPSPRLAGAGWKNKIIPVDATQGCNTVWIQAAGDGTNGGKYLSYGSCSSQTAFSWAEVSSSTAIQWKLTKAD